jgi:biopolymer transport protein ExbD
MNAWLVRKEGAHAAVELPTVEAVIAALRDGLYDPTDEVKGPTDAAFVRIEAHPALEEVASEVEFYRGDEKDETHLDMNPLIDVCLVLLIFFILTITYESLKRALDMPDLPSEQKQAEKPKIDLQKERNKYVVVQARMVGDKPVIKVEQKECPVDDLLKRLADEFGKKTGERRLILDVEGAVPWGVQTKIMDAAKGNKVEQIIYPPLKKSKST